MKCMNKGCGEEATYQETNRIHGNLYYCDKHASTYNKIMGVLGF